MAEVPYIGQMDRLIGIQAEVTTRTTTGEEQASFEVVAAPYAYMEEANGSEEVDGKVRHLITRTYTIRYNANVLQNGTKYKVLDEGIQFDVYHVKQIGRKRFLKLMVTNYE